MVHVWRADVRSFVTKRSAREAEQGPHVEDRSVREANVLNVIVYIIGSKSTQVASKKYAGAGVSQERKRSVR